MKYASELLHELYSLAIVVVVFIAIIIMVKAYASSTPEVVLPAIEVGPECVLTGTFETARKDRFLALYQCEVK